MNYPLNYNHDNAPSKCPSCGGDWFTEHVTHSDANVVSEFYVSCVWCHEYVAFWAYGYYQPPEI